MEQEEPTPMSSIIDWERLAQRLGSLHSDGESGGSDLARKALEEILGSSVWRNAVDHYVADKPGYELARSVLWLIHPWAAMERCYEIYRTSQDTETRRNAVALLRVVADRRALSWVDEFLNDSDPGVQNWGAGMVDQLLWSELVEPEECQELLEKMKQHPNEHLRETATWIESFLQKRKNQSGKI
jgi:hypothetical protein